MNHELSYLRSPARGHGSSSALGFPSEGWSRVTILEYPVINLVRSDSMKGRVSSVLSIERRGLRADEIPHAERLEQVFLVGLDVKLPNASIFYVVVEKLTILTGEERVEALRGPQARVMPKIQRVWPVGIAENSIVAMRADLGIDIGFYLWKNTSGIVDVTGPSRGIEALACAENLVVDTDGQQQSDRQHSLSSSYSAQDVHARREKEQENRWIKDGAHTEIEGGNSRQPSVE